MEKFEGAKFYCDGTYLVRDESVTWEDRYITKKHFMITSTYRKYLEAKREEERQDELRTMRCKLEWQYKTYGEVDPIDYAEFIAKLNG